MASNLPPLPPGFTLDQAQGGASVVPPPPPGFTIDQTPQPAGKTEPYSGSILPFSKDDQGNVSFDTNAGILGSIKRAFTLPGEVYQGKIDPKSNEGIARATEMGMVFSPVNPAVRAGEKALPGVLRASKPRAPTVNELRAAASSGFDAARNMGVDYSGAAVGKMATTLRGQLEQDGILAELAPKTFSILKKLESPPDGSVATLSQLIAARRALGNAGRDFTNPTEQLASSRLVAGLDRFIQGHDAASVVAGPAAAASKIVRDAQGNYSAAKRSERLFGIDRPAGAPVQGIEGSARLRAAAANSGQNLDNAIRSRVASLLLDPKKIAGFSKSEVALLTKVAEGTATRNMIRDAGNILGGGGGLGAFLSAAVGGMVGGAAGGPLGVAAGVTLPTLGRGGKAIANALTTNALRKADEAVRMRSPLYKANPPMSVISPERRAAVTRMLLLQKQNPTAQ